MQIKYQNIVLRDYQASDIEDGVRWNTAETQWGLWDAPWETEEAFRTFDPAVFRAERKKRLGIPQKPDALRWSFEIDAGGVHIGFVNAYVIDDQYQWRRLEPAETLDSGLRIAVGIDICEHEYWSGGWGAQALTAFVRYWLKSGFQNIYTQTWSGNLRMIGLAKKLGFVECCRKEGIYQVRGGQYDGLTFRLDPSAFAAHCEWQGRAGLELYIPKPEDMWFVRQMQEDPATMSYNAGWDVSYPGYHPDTGCIDFPESEWAGKLAGLVGHEPERFYALIRDAATGAFLGEVNFHGHGQGMGIILYAPYRGRGYGLPALDLLLRHAFVDCGLSSLRNDFEVDRDAGLAVHLAAGFRPVGTGAANRFGKPVELQELELTRERYYALRSDIVPLTDPEEKVRIASSILAGLPNWFGLPDSTAEYVKNSRDLPFWAARLGNDDLGFIVLKPTAPKTAEVYVMGVRPGYHRSGLGRRLFGALRQYAKEQGFAFLQVKTVQEGRYPEYDRTIAFYRAMGFTEFECLPTLWDEWNPCQVFIQAL